MAVTLSHQSALDVIRVVRSRGVNLYEADVTSLATPEPWIGKNWSMQNFTSSEWQWQQPSPKHPLQVLAPRLTSKKTSLLDLHILYRTTSTFSVLWLDEHTSVIRPELLFLQMAAHFAIPRLVMLGNELCGHFSRAWNNPLNGPVELGLPSATSVSQLQGYLQTCHKVKGLPRAKEALNYIVDHAVSPPESVLATMYSLPTKESGYEFGSVTLNECVSVGSGDLWERNRHRYPDLMFSFASVGINYDGEDHLDLKGLAQIARAAALAEPEDREKAKRILQLKLDEVREKYLDDIHRTRELAAKGKIVLPATKEDLEDITSLDNFTRDLLGCAHSILGMDTSSYEKTLNNTVLQRDRSELLRSLMPFGQSAASSYGKM